MLGVSSPDSQRLSAILHSVAEAIVATDRAGVLTLVNPAAEKLFGVQASETVSAGTRLSAVSKVLGNWLERALDEKRTQPLVFELAWDADKHFSVSLAPLATENGSAPGGWVLVLQDITHLKHLEQWKSEAIQTAAHDLRNPLSMLTGATNLLRDMLTDPTPEQLECLNMLKLGSERMTALIEQLLNLENVEAGSDITMSKVTLRRVVEEVVAELKLAADQKKIMLAFEGVAATARVLGDESWLRRAVVNLLSNALKYTPEGGQVQVRYREADDQGIVEVTDNGLGIPQVAQARLFERFYRVRTEATRHTPGTGLGLAIVKTIVEKHAGRVWVSSEEGKGSTFGFAVPLLK
jgi:two-component system phosphate regulon sensor histidine kinase PhoR